MSETYNGWANWETWSVHLWLTNEEDTYRHWEERAGEIAEDVDHEDALHFLSGELRTVVPNDGSVRDSVSWHRVDWRQVAEAFLPETGLRA
jgi:hypothetical protein